MPRIAIIDTGFGGRWMAIQVIRAGSRPFTLFDKAGIKQRHVTT